jgi:FkbM family methyltransferase
MRVVSSLETEVEAAFFACLQLDATVYDIGANVGWFSLLAARSVGAGGRVIAFEPSIENAAVLQANARSNGFSNITAIPAGVADRDGWDGFSAASSLQGHLDPSGSELVPLIAVDSWLTTTGERPPEVVKIDVEGAEAAVLRGMTPTLRSSRPTLIIELHNTANEVANILDSVGYRHSLIDAPGEVRGAPWWAHVIGRPGIERTCKPPQQLVGRLGIGSEPPAAVSRLSSVVHHTTASCRDRVHHVRLPARDHIRIDASLARRAEPTLQTGDPTEQRTAWAAPSGRPISGPARTR